MSLDVSYCAMSQSRLLLSPLCSYSPGIYDLTNMFSHTTNLQRLCLEGVGYAFPLNTLLRSCPELRELELKNTSVVLPETVDSIEGHSPHGNIKTFHLVGDAFSLSANPLLTVAIAHLMPSLEELELQPQTVLGYQGMTPLQVRALARLVNLKKLSVPLSLHACTMNMPMIIFVLRDFVCLRFLVLSWVKQHNCYDLTDSNIISCMRFLYSALIGGNSVIHLQLCFRLHPRLYYISR